MKWDFERITRSMSGEQTLLFCVLFGTLPAVEDLSLFVLDRIAALEIIVGVPTSRSEILQVCCFLLLPVGYAITLRTRRLSFLFGLLPGTLAILLLGFELYGAGDRYGISALLLSSSYKIAFLLFVIRGHVRSHAFVLAAFSAAVLVPLHHALLFVIAVCTGRFIHIAITQNVEIFRRIQKLELLRLAARSLLIWSPVMLLSVPHFTFQRALEHLATDMVYDETFIERHHVYTELTLRQLLENYRSENQGYVESLLESRPRPAEGVEWLSSSGLQSSWPADKIQDWAWRSIAYLSTLEAKSFRNYEEPARIFREAMLAQVPQGPPDQDLLFVMELVAGQLEKIAIKNEFWGESEIALDVQLSVHQALAERQDRINADLDEGQRQIDGTVDQQIAAVDEVGANITRGSEAFLSQTFATTEAKKREFRDQIIGPAGTEFQAGVSRTLEQIQSSAQDEIDQIPDKSLRAFDAALPQDLTELSPGFAHEQSCGFLDISCHAKNGMTGLLRSAYRKQRTRAAEAVADQSLVLRNQASSKLDSAVEQAEAETQKVVQSTETKLNEVADDAAGVVNRTIAEIDQELKAVVRDGAGQVKAQMAPIKATVGEHKAALEEELDRGIREINEKTSQAVLLIHSYVTFTQAVTAGAYVLLIIISYLYVFSRIAFAEEHDLFVTIREGAEGSARGEVKQWGSAYSIAADHQEAFYVSRRFAPTGRAPKFAIPQWTTSPFARLIRRVYAMNEIAVRDDRHESIDFRSVAGSEFLEWQLADGEEVVFLYENFVAMGESVRLSTHISLRFTSLLMGRPFFYIAKGPGSLILLTDGVPITDTEASLVKSVSAERMIAFQKSALFSVDSEINPVDIYFSDLYLRRSSDALMVVDADSGATKTKAGMLKFVLKFIFPF